METCLTGLPDKANDNALLIAIGNDADGNDIELDFSKMGHLLIGGSTGSGKSTLLHAIIFSIMKRTVPGKTRLILIDTKRTEFEPLYADMPHLCAPVITEADAAIRALSWCVREIKRRNNELAASTAGISADHFEPNITPLRNEKEGQSPQIVVIIDEFADLAREYGSLFEQLSSAIAYSGSAVGIHLIMATQCVTADVVTRQIKANFPSRIAFSLATESDSRAIIDEGGAERLAKPGDMLLVNREQPQPLFVACRYAAYMGHR